MNELTIFQNPEFGLIRATSINGVPWAVGRDVADALGYSNPQKAIRDHVEVEDKGVNEMDTPGGKQQIVMINESGIYSLIFGSKLTRAREFKHWVTSEVLPSIRKNGAYIDGQEQLSDDDLIAKALIAANRIIEEKKQLISEMKPKAIFADAVMASQSTILIGELAKILKANGYDTGQNRLFEQLRKDGYLISRAGSDYNMPTQKSMELGLMKIKETAITHADGHVSVAKTVKITGKGQQYFINRYCKKA